jgi:hypothetical protein
MPAAKRGTFSLKQFCSGRQVVRSVATRISASARKPCMGGLLAGGSSEGVRYPPECRSGLKSEEIPIGRVAQLVRAPASHLGGGLGSRLDNMGS